MAKPFSERNPVVIGAVGLVVLALVMLMAFNAGSLPLIGGGTTYSAAFSEAGGLKPNDEVRIAGVKVGKVTGVDLEGDHVKVTFKVKDAWVGDNSRADIKIKTLLGAKYLALDPAGAKEADPDQEIPITRTHAAYDVVPAFSELTEVVGKIDKTKLEQAFNTLSATFENTPDQVKGSLTGLSKLSNTIASRDQALTELLARTKTVTKTLADRSDDLVTLMSDANLLLKEVQDRRDVIHQLLVNTTELAVQLQGLIKDNNAQLKPSLDQLAKVVDTLQRNQDALDKGLQELAPFLTVFTNTIGNGRWFDNYVQNLLTPIPTGVSIIPTPTVQTGGN